MYRKLIKTAQRTTFLSVNDRSASIIAFRLACSIRHKWLQSDRSKRNHAAHDEERPSEPAKSRHPQNVNDVASERRLPTFELAAKSNAVRKILAVSRVRLTLRYKPRTLSQRGMALQVTCQFSQLRLEDFGLVNPQIGSS